MSGMSGVSAARQMPANCGMQGMHGNGKVDHKQHESAQVTKQQNTQPQKASDSVKGTKLDVSI